MLPVAHRTPRTSAGCAALAAAGARVFELDVQLVGGELVVSHYLPLFGGLAEHDNWRVRLRPFRRRSSQRRLSRRDPAVLDVVDLVPAGCAILLDPKARGDGSRAALAAALADALGDRSRFRVSTGDAADLERYRTAGFTTWRTIASTAQLDEVVAGDVLPDAGVSVRHTLLDAARIRALHRVTRLVVAWTVNDVARARTLTAQGVDGVTTDRPAVLAAVSP